MCDCFGVIMTDTSKARLW